MGLVHKIVVHVVKGSVYFLGGEPVVLVGKTHLYDVDYLGPGIVPKIHPDIPHHGDFDN